MMMRNQINKQSAQIKRLEQEVQRLEQASNEKDVDKLYKSQQQNYELLRRYIDEVNIYTKDFHDRILLKMNLKADNDLFQLFQDNVQEKILSQLKMKIDKIEMKRAQNALRRKLDRLEDKVCDLKTGKPGTAFGVPGLTNYNKKCISCFRELPDELYNLRMLP